MNVFEAYGKEVVFAVVLGLVTNNIFRNRRKALPPPQTPNITPSLVPVTDVFTENELSVIANCYEHEGPDGKFIKGRHGFTHYVLDHPKDLTRSKGIVILGHGLGTSLRMYGELTDFLVDDGYSVFRYDYFGHGYGKFSGSEWTEYKPDIFVDQLEDLLDYISMNEKQEVVGYIGHSNGGVNIISAYNRLASYEGNGKIIPKIVIANPAIYAEKPITGKIADRIPGVLRGLFQKLPFTISIVGDGYIEAGKTAFARDPKTKEYLFPQSEEAASRKTARLFGKVKGVKPHPFLSQSIFSVSSYNIPDSLLSTHRKRLVEMLEYSGEKKCDVLFAWGDLDLTVPYKEHFEEINELSKKYDNLTFETLAGIGHECFYEDNKAFSKLVLPFLNA
mmetsp:Transcript_27138/g.31032  ORF Transcript_27138/g.31032 Transcript_27138/m.31032 type:complete len:390 (-) Transcript_27138:111-1280(-)